MGGSGHTPSAAGASPPMRGAEDGHDDPSATARAGDAEQSGGRGREPGEGTRKVDAAGLSEADRRLVTELRARDMEVRAHEQAHLAAAGQLATGGPSFETVRGPDGRQYAVAGEVHIDTAPVPGDPEATLRKAAQIRRAATAPAEPSGQDLAVAAQASAMAQQARAELMTQRLAGTDGEGTPSREVGATDARGRAEETSNGHCAICGGAHSAGDHSSANVTRIEHAVAGTRPAEPPRISLQA
ncbi:MAG: hypothetical protein H6983_25275 [Ectothiorhodospiraceae bacterium]|nr:hypothetical protein [Chromatiales bacterium]MCP5157512.1 hypothetical protein [Ectothiorhodospiraceae bacterium]